MSTQEYIVFRAESALTDDYQTIAPLSEMGMIALGKAFKPGFEAKSMQVDVIEATESEISKISAEKDVVGTSPTMKVRHVQDMIPGSVAVQSIGNAELPDISWGIDSVGATDLPLDAGEGVRVAILDTGIDPGHPAFRDVDLRDEDYVDFTNTGRTDRIGHGTHCAGTIFGADAATETSSGQVTTRIGIARGIRNPLIGKVLAHNVGDTQTVVKGVMWAIHKGAQIINMSLGLDFSQQVDYWLNKGLPPPQARAKALANYRESILVFERLANLATGNISSQFPLIVAAAGNSSRRGDFVIEAEPPAASPGVLSVGAIAPDLSVWKNSNSRPNLCGPGVGIWSAVPGGGIAPADGTSMAAPHAVGVAAIHTQTMMAEGYFSAERLRGKIMGTLAKLNDHPTEVGDGQVHI